MSKSKIYSWLVFILLIGGNSNLLSQSYIFPVVSYNNSARSWQSPVLYDYLDSTRTNNLSIGIGIEQYFIDKFKLSVIARYQINKSTIDIFSFSFNPFLYLNYNTMDFSSIISFYPKPRIIIQTGINIKRYYNIEEKWAYSNNNSSKFKTNHNIDYIIGIGYEYKSLGVLLNYSSMLKNNGYLPLINANMIELLFYYKFKVFDKIELSKKAAACPDF